MKHKHTKKLAHLHNNCLRMLNQNINSFRTGVRLPIRNVKIQKRFDRAICLQQINCILQQQRLSYSTFRRLLQIQKITINMSMFNNLITTEPHSSKALTIYLNRDN